ncbi:MAG: OB-fold domain-containing protein [Dehalococcoidia bacterium]|nr:OB-fold domain-containing protein [Dehalococcoidia bacterium]
MTTGQPAPAGKPVPLPDDLTAPYWEGAGRRELCIQRCCRCRTFAHPPESLCPACNSPELRFEAVSGRGRVYSFTVVRDNVTRGFEAEVPYVVALVELAEQKRLIVVTNLPEADPERVRVGSPVVVDFEARDGMTVPQFRLASDDR